VSRWLDQVLEKEIPALTPSRTEEEAERHVLDKKKVQSKVWRPKPKADDGKDDKPQADINMVVSYQESSWLQLIQMCPMKNLAWHN
jgi:hypothetical protein